VKNITGCFGTATYDDACNLAYGLRVCTGNKTFLMKKYSFALLALAAVAVANARAAHRETSSPLLLPTYVVEAERVSSVESHVNRSLNALRELARAPIVVSIELPALKAPVTLDTKAAPPARLAKF
jgi:hypothetical protein